MRKFLFFLSICALAPAPTFGGQVDTLDIFSVSMRKNIGCAVVTPDSYDAAGAPYPVLYLLHGYSGDYTGWLNDAPQLQQHADAYRLIIVCPDGGYDSWYFDSPVDSSVRYETHIVREVVPFIDEKYNTRNARSGRAIAGLSMGGHGALYLAARNPEVFGAAGSMAGGLDLRPFRQNNWDLAGVLGAADGESWKNWEVHSVINLVPKLKTAKLRLIIDCGMDDFFLQVNQNMHAALLQAGILHDYIERPGGHTGEYWGSAVDTQLVFFDKFFNEP